MPRKGLVMAVPFGAWLVRRLPGATRPALALEQAPQGLFLVWAAYAGLLLEEAGRAIAPVPLHGTLVAAQNYTPGGVKVFDARTLALVADSPAEYAPGKLSRVVGLVDLPQRAARTCPRMPCHPRPAFPGDSRAGRGGTRR